MIHNHIRLISLLGVVGATTAVLLFGGRWFGDEGSAGTIDAGHRAAVDSRIAVAPKSAFQESILSDGEVTFAEYHGAMEAYVACALAAGATPARGPALTAAQIYDIGFLLGKNEPGGQGSVVLNERWAKVQACSKEHWDLVHQKWTAEHLPSHDRVVAAVGDVTACMRARGVDAPVSPAKGWSTKFWTSDDFSEAEGIAYRECSMQVYEALGFPKGSVPVP